MVTAVTPACIKKNIKIGEFLCSHFDIEDGSKYATFLTYNALLFQERYKYKWNPQKTCAVYGEGAVADWMCQKWFAELRAGDFLLVNAPQSDRPGDIDGGQVETLIESNQCYAMQEIADILKNIQINSYWWKWKICLLFYGKNQEFGEVLMYLCIFTRLAGL